MSEFQPVRFNMKSRGPAEPKYKRHEKIGPFTILGYEGYHKGNGRHMYKVKCKCGNIHRRGQSRIMETSGGCIKCANQKKRLNQIKASGYVNEDLMREAKKVLRKGWGLVG